MGRYSFLESKASFYFAIDENTGNISSLGGAPFDYEQETLLSFIVVATDMREYTIHKINSRKPGL